MSTPKVSVIIPVFNVASYLRESLDSVICQTYSNIEIIIIDDGSTDGSNLICDEYKAKDDRIVLFYTENRGLSAARNYGIDHSSGEFIAFLDGDDWLEPDMIELLLSSIMSVDADIAECGYYLEYQNFRYPDITPLNDIILLKEDILNACYCEDVRNVVWDKLYCRELFNDIRYPEGRLYEDIATTHRILALADKLVWIQKPLVHYRQRESSISSSHYMKNLVDYWIAHKEKFGTLGNIDRAGKIKLLNRCMLAIGRFWRWYYNCEEDGRSQVEEMQAFAHKYEDEVLHNKRYSRFARFSCYMARYSNPWVFCHLYYLNQIYRFLKIKKYRKYP